MSDTDRPVRPRQLTVAGGFVIGGSVLLVLTIFDAITSLRSIEMRDQITQLVTSPTGEGLGLSVSEMLSAMRVGLMFAAGCAAAAAVLGVYAVQGSKAARLALSILAVPILLTAPLTGGLVGALVAAAIAMLWSGQARDWFDGRPVREAGAAGASGSPTSTGQNPWGQAPRPGARPEARPGARPGEQPHDRATTPGGSAADGGGSPAAPAATSLTTAGTSTEPGTTSGFGRHPHDGPVDGRVDGRAEGPVDTLVPPSAYPGTPGGLPAAYAAIARGNGVPVTVKVACILTWVFSGVVALLYTALLVSLVAAQDRIVDFVVSTPAWGRAQLDRDMLVPVLWLGCLMFLGWSVGACVLAWFTWKRHNWARWLLAASAGATVVAAFFAFPVGVLHQLAAALTLAGLFGSAARVWFAPRTWTPGPSGGPPPPSPGSQLPGPPPPGHHPPPDRPPVGSPPPGGKPPVW